MSQTLLKLASGPSEKIGFTKIYLTDAWVMETGHEIHFDTITSWIWFIESLHALSEKLKRKGWVVNAGLQSADIQCGEIRRWMLTDYCHQIKLQKLFLDKEPDLCFFLICIWMSSVTLWLNAEFFLNNWSIHEWKHFSQSSRLKSWNVLMNSRFKVSNTGRWVILSSRSVIHLMAKLQII